jgi:hypothetical protein
MKKVFVSLTIIASLFTGTAHAHGQWVGPALIGGIIGYELGRPNTVYVQQQPPVIVQQQPPVIVQQQPPVYVPQYVCELRSEMINGRVVQGQFCHN